MLPVEVLGDVRVRTQQHVAVRLNDANALAVAVISASIEPVELLEYAFDGTVRRDALEARAQLALTAHEFGALFGARGDGQASAFCAYPSKKLAALDASPTGVAMRRRLEQALVCTLVEAAPASIWQKHPGVRLAAAVALHRDEDATEALSAVLGGLVAADSRRVEDLKTALEDAGVDLIFVSEAVSALGECAIV
jgi:hypothetical protein